MKTLINMEKNTLSLQEAYDLIEEFNQKARTAFGLNAVMEHGVLDEGQ
jgi:hypothetical protein